jgi:acetyl-CoA decarbonylase/synthase complex subunit delta
MEKKITLKDLTRILENYEIIELEDVKIQGDIEIELSPGGVLPASVIQLLQSLIGGVEEGVKERVMELTEAKFESSKAEWAGKIEEVTIGATSVDGGTREQTVTIGGERSLPFYNFDYPMPHPPVISIDCFDMTIPLARAVREYYDDVMNDPGDWAKKNVREFGADMVTIHLISTDPTIKDTSAKEAAKTVEEVLQAVKVPIVIGGSGNPDKDPAVLEAAAEVAEGERCLIASANLNMDYERIAKAALDHGHVILSWTQLDINAQKTLNRYLFKLGVPREDIVIDPTTAALGYGLDYAYTNIERMRISALKGDTDLAFPISCGITNAWGARESWMKASPIVEDSDWGPAAYRGPLYEIVTGLTLGIAGGDLFMMMHPMAASAIKRVTEMLFCAKDDATKIVMTEDWVTWDGGVQKK